MTPASDRLVPESLLADEDERVQFVSHRAVALQGLLYLGGLAVFVLLLFRSGPQMGPIVIGLTGALLLWPLRRERPARALLMAGGLLVGLALLQLIGGVLAPFILVFVLAYLLDPAVAWARRRWNVPRWASALVLTLGVVGLMVAAGFFLVPTLVQQVQELAQDAIALLRTLPATVARSPALDQLEEAGIVEREVLVQQLTTFLPQQIQGIAGRIPAVLGGITRQIGTLLGLVTTVALIPVLLFYMLADLPRVQRALSELFPRFRGSKAYLTRVGEVVGNYLRGQLTVSAISAVMVAVPLLLLGAPFALLLGVAAGVLNMIPSVGSLLTYALGLGLMLAFGDTGDVIAVVIVLAVQAILEQAVLTPRVMSSSVGLHPLLVILSLFVFGALFGFIGLLVAVPATALLMNLYRTFKGGMALDLDAGGPPPLIVPATEATPLLGTPADAARAEKSE